MRQDTASLSCRNKTLTIYSKTFSCLVHAKRPLSLDELCEAIEIFDHPRGENLEPGCVVFRSKLQDVCAPLISIEETWTRAGHKQQVVKLTHGSVKTFLVKNPTVLSDKEDHRISPDVMAWACFKYLRQPMYSQPLTKGKGTFLTACGKDILGHELLAYSAKYWPRHMDALPYSKEICKEVEEFVRSPNFIACLQVQSLLVGGESDLPCDVVYLRVSYAEYTSYRTIQHLVWVIRAIQRQTIRASVPTLVY